MSRLKFALVITILAIGLVVFAFSRVATKSSVSVASVPVPNFTLLDHQGVSHSLYGHGDAKRIAIIGQANDCGYLKEHGALLKALTEDVALEGVGFFMINPRQEDEHLQIQAAAEIFDNRIPILMDPSQIVTRALGLSRAGDLVVIDTSNWKITYRGYLHDENLSKALNGLSTPSQSAQPGPCEFHFASSAPLSYAKDIAPILTEKCGNCHSLPGEFQPKFTSFEAIKSWSAMIKETLLTDRMPPWSADPLYGKYLNDISLTADEKRVLVQWIDQGLPRDSTQDPLVDFRPAHRRKPSVLNRKPIYTVAMDRDLDIPPQGYPAYNFFQLGGPAPFDIWADAFFSRSTNPRQLHHQGLLITPKPLSYYKAIAKPRLPEIAPDAYQRGEIPNAVFSAMEEEADPNYTRIQNRTLGLLQPLVMPPGTMTFIPKGYYIILETHHMGTGKPETEKTTIEIYGSRKRAEGKEIRTYRFLGKRLKIPPGSRNYIAGTALVPVTRDIELRSFMAHLHMRGRSVKVIGIDRAGEHKTLFTIPNYYYGWQTGAGLRFEKPILVKAGTRLKMICEYDNSKWNPNNPDPTRTVLWGQVIDKAEMCRSSIGYTYAD